MKAKDATALSGYEVCYNAANAVGRKGTGDTTSFMSMTKLRFYITSQANINPDYSPVIRYVPLGDYQSTDAPNEMLTGVGFQDNTAHTPIGSATAQTLTVTIV